MDQVKFVDDSLSRPFYFKFCIDCLHTSFTWFNLEYLNPFGVSQCPAHGVMFQFSKWFSFYNLKFLQPSEFDRKKYTVIEER